ncbi:MAG: hypothetical protein ACKPJA_09335, partial [Microcystis panniformis]
MKTQGFEARFSQNLAPVSREKPQNPYLAYISPLFSKTYLNLLTGFSIMAQFACLLLTIDNIRSRANN